MLVTRIITGAILGVAIAVTLLLLPTPVAAGVFGLLWLAGAWEWGGFALLTGSARALYTLALGIGMGACWFWQAPGLVLILLVVALVWWAFAFGAVVRFPQRFALGFVAAAGFVVLLPSWLLLVWMHGSTALGSELAFTLMVIVWAADVGAYAFGRWLGRVKLAPAVSPGKTWEGVGGGLLAAALVAAVAARLLGLPVLGFVGLGLATALVSVLGDLAQSMFKRNVGLKDSGKLLPGHGGVLDRFDSLTAAIPVFVLGLELLGVFG